jgi:hypothetical protein
VTDILTMLTAMSEALLRIVVGAALIPHGLRMTFGFFRKTGQPLRNPRILAEYLDKQGYRPWRLWALGDLGNPTRLRASARRWVVHARGRGASGALSAGDERRALVRRTILLESARARIHADVDHRRGLLPGPRRRYDLA